MRKPNQKPTLLILGYGNMAEAILRDNDYILSHYHIEVGGRNADKIRQFIKTCHLKNAKILSSQTPKNTQKIDINGKDVLLCIKPNALSNFTFSSKARRVYSVIAGVSVNTLKSHIKAGEFIRLMPNIAAMYKQSATAGFIATPNLTESSKNDIANFICSFGNFIEVSNESLIDASIATSGSAIAFLALVAESLIDAGVYEGLNAMQSANLVRQTFAGFSQMLGEKSPSAIKYAVSSPAGTTIRGLAVLEENALRGSIIKAACASAEYAKDSIKK